MKMALYPGSKLTTKDGRLYRWTGGGLGPIFPQDWN